MAICLHKSQSHRFSCLLIKSIKRNTVSLLSVSRLFFFIAYTTQRKSCACRKYRFSGALSHLGMFSSVGEDGHRSRASPTPLYWQDWHRIVFVRDPGATPDGS